jgi:AcrR family transcriptional regulator
VKTTQTSVITKRTAGKMAMQERILETTDRLFYRQGIRAVGVDTIAAAVGISKRTLYNHFPSKDELIVAYLTRRFRPISASDAPPAEQVLAEFDRLERNFASDGFRGCPFVNAVAELGEPTNAARGIAVAFKEQRRLWFRELLTRLGARDPEGLATQLSLLADGAIAAALVRGDPTMARAAREAARTLLSAGGAQLPSSTEKGAKRRARRRAGRARIARP